ncbi:hypothetical protein B0T10DRAFT_495596 [Thelonectria olida]|uniref:Protein kinase domain-containing protein n=1 Tax=Thelonectria olida TaxID=1576542 RepID=A0A9P8VVG7_9HYPO|nr:hypothetical protein B0T10DRAFT_495596 [Thelonectria olida]
MPWVGGRYSVSSWSRYHTARNGRESAVNIRINGRRFSVIMTPTNFENSPIRSLELRNCLDVLHGPDWQDEEADNDSGVFLSSPGEGARTWDVIEEAFDWAVGPYLDEFERMAPPPDKDATLTLGDMFHDDAFMCRLGSVNDQFVLGPIEKYVATPYHHPLMFHIFNATSPSEDSPGQAWSTTFPCFLPKDVEIQSEAWDRTKDMQHVKSYCARIPGIDQHLYYKRFRGSQTEWKGEIRKYEAIVEANLGLDVYILRPRGDVRDEEGRPLGLLLPRIAQARCLSPEVRHRPPTPEIGERWIRQIERTVSALHAVGIIWGNASSRNVLIDEDEDAWVVDFGEKRRPYDEGEEDPNTVLGDLQGVRKIRACIQDQDAETP